MSNAEKGYLLPDNPIVNEELSCTIVWYPDRDEYRRALLGSLHYLATWLAWERDTAHGGTIAAQAWKQANDLTMECWQMACLDQLQSDVRAIRNLLAGMGYCCDGTITYGPPTVVDPPFTPGAGDPPTTYGQTSIADWDEWTEYACYNAQAYVDYLIQQAESFAAAAQTTSYTIGLVAAGLALLSFTGIGLPIAFAVASTALFALLQAGSDIFDDVADDIEAAREDIVCAIIVGDNLADAVGNAIGTSSAAWLSLYQFVDYGSASSIIQQGGYGTEYLPAETDDSCAGCAEAEHIIYTFDANSDTWSMTGRCDWQSDAGLGRMRLYPTLSSGSFQNTRDNLASRAGIQSDTLKLSELVFDYTVNDLGCSKSLRVTITYTDNTTTIFDATWQNESGTQSIICDDTKVLKSGVGINCIVFAGLGTTSCNTSIRIDNVKLYYLGTPV